MPEPSSPTQDLDALKRQQVASYAELYGDEAKRSQVPWSRIRTWQEMGQIDHAIKMIGGDLTGKKVLTVCSGRGIESARLAEAGADVTATDLSPDSVNRLAEAHPGLTARQADAEALPFEDGSFDIVWVRRGLHHLPRPLLGVYEMARVSRSQVVLLEAQDNTLTRMMTSGKLFGLIPHGGRVECHGNYIYRFTRRELDKLAAAMFLKGVRYRAEWHHNNYVVEGFHHKLCQNGPGFALGKAFYRTVNALIGRWGNNLTVVIDKQRPSETGDDG